VRKLIALSVCLACLLVLAAGPVRAEDSKPAFVHFVVLPKVLPDGRAYEAVSEEFQVEMVKLAGGFTELGGARGGSMLSDQFVPKDNVAYLVASDEDISLQIKAEVMRIFGLERVFILVWPGSMVR